MPQRKLIDFIPGNKRNIEHIKIVCKGSDQPGSPAFFHITVRFACQRVITTLEPRIALSGHNIVVEDKKSYFTEYEIIIDHLHKYYQVVKNKDDGLDGLKDEKLNVADKDYIDEQLKIWVEQNT